MHPGIEVSQATTIPINIARRKSILTPIPDLAWAGSRFGLHEDEQCQRVGGGYKAVTFRFLLFL